VDEAWRPHFVSARYLLDNSGDLDKALGYIDQSIAIKPTWWNHWVRAQLLAKKGRTADAVAAAETTLKLGTGDKLFESAFKADVNKSLAGWKKKP
jgi:predicted TPR repeat methyltransferase